MKIRLCDIYTLEFMVTPNRSMITAALWWCDRSMTRAGPSVQLWKLWWECSVMPQNDPVNQSLSL